MTGQQRDIQQPLQQRRADASPAPGREHRHATDVPVGEQAAGADRRTVGLGDPMSAGRVEFVPFEGLGHRLLAHEDRMAHGAQGGAIRRPVGGANDEGCGRIHRSDYIGAMRSRRLWPMPFLGLLLVVLAALPARGLEPVAYSLDTLPEQELWAGIAFGEARVGYGHTVVRPAGAGRFEIRSETSIFLRLLGFAKTIEFRSIDVVGADLGLQRFEAEYRMDGNLLAMTGRREGDRLVVHLDNAGARTEREFTVSGALLPASAIGLHPLLQGLEAGRRYRFSAFSPETLQLAAVEQRVVADGDGFAVHSRFQGMEGVLRLSASGRVMSETAMGGLMSAMPVTEADARAWLEAARTNTQDVVVDMSLVRANRTVPLPSRVARMRVSLEGVSIDMPSGTGQACTHVAPRWDCNLDSAMREPATGDTGRWLQPSFTVPSTDARIVKLSRQITAQSTTDEERVRDLLRWLDANIRKEGADAFSALDVLASRRGECQGHSYLYAALARAAGIPTRVVNGLVYAEEHAGFLYHTWTESRLDGQWRAVDPTFGQASADATHIKLLEGEDYGDVAPLMDLIGRVAIRIASFEYRR